MFKVGDFVVLNQKPYSDFIVTRIYSDKYMAVAKFDVLDGFIEDEYKVKQKYFELLDLDKFIVLGMSYRQMRKNFVDCGYFSENRDESLSLNYTENSKKGISPTWGLDLEFYPITAID
jgi:hypothetical protein